ncbi:hypothetical protein MKZ38_004789 [Zalerion maritima]|uniref:Uncharacterized protein n=1 Tax=Zalerion maritima TaxID=339359 RepID=A0AAD5RL46_9PEZI|nr:hypothetical protein MKZ38_004789 [Zalerion maritima]
MVPPSSLGSSPADELDVIKQALFSVATRSEATTTSSPDAHPNVGQLPPHQDQHQHGSMYSSTSHLVSGMDTMSPLAPSRQGMWTTDSLLAPGHATTAASDSPQHHQRANGAWYLGRHREANSMTDKSWLPVDRPCRGCVGQSGGDRGGGMAMNQHAHQEIQLGDPGSSEHGSTRGRRRLERSEGTGSIAPRSDVSTRAALGEAATAVSSNSRGSRVSR